MDTIERLTSLFERFPGIGPRQAQRFVQFLLRSSPAVRRELVEAVQHLGNAVHQCPQCMRFHAGERKICSICTNDERGKEFLMIVASDADLHALERSGTYHGHYFVLGGTISLANEKSTNLRIPQLLTLVASRKELEEVVLAFPANPEGDATAARVRQEIAKATPELRVTELGRGLSTGSELEYADPETIKSALESRR